MVEKLWPGQDPLTRHVKEGDTWAQVVGVVGDIQYSGPAEPVGHQIYQSVNQNTWPGLTFVLRTLPQFHGDPLTLAEPARAVVAQINPRLAVSNITSLELLAQQCQWQHLPAHQPLLLRADPQRDVYFLLSGRLRVTSYSANGRQVSFRDSV